MNRSNQTIDSVLENLFYVVPMLHKKFLKVDLQGIDAGCRLSRLHVGIMGRLSRVSRLTVSDLANTFLILKPQMTRILDELADAQLVLRLPDTADRRLVFISLTEAGHKTLAQCHEQWKSHVRRQISSLSSAELEELCNSLIKLRAIGERLEN
jgi:DNA-binding MarR family transcriptional regulator